MKKRLVVCLLAVVLVLGLAVSASAAEGDPTVTLAASSNTIKAGDEVTITATLGDCSPLMAVKFVVVYSTTDFTLVEGSVEANTLMSGANPNGSTAGRVVCQWSYGGNPIDLSNQVLLTFKLKANQTAQSADLLSSLTIEKSDSDFLAGGTVTAVQVITGNVVNTDVTIQHVHSAEPVEGDDAWTVDNDATCTTIGQSHYVCTYCNENVTKDIPAKGHTMGAKVAGTPATCVTTGTADTWTCSVCGKTYLDELGSADKEVTDENNADVLPIDAANHEDLDYVPALEPVKNADKSVTPGYYEHMYCTACQHYYYVTTDGESGHIIDTSKGNEGLYVQDTYDGTMPEELVKTIVKVPGDVYDDGEINNLDALYLALYVAEFDLSTVEKFNLDNADVDGNPGVNNIDALYLALYVAEYDITLQ